MGAGTLRRRHAEHNARRAAVAQERRVYDEKFVEAEALARGEVVAPAVSETVPAVAVQLPTVAAVAAAADTRTQQQPGRQQRQHQHQHRR